MSALFRRRKPPPPPEPKPPPELPDMGKLPSDGSQTIYVTGDARRDTDRIRSLVESLREVSSTEDHEELMVRMVDRAIRVVGAERGLLFMTDEEGLPRLRVGRAAAGTDLPRETAFSSQVVAAVFDSKKPIHQKTDDSQSDFDPSQSILDLSIRAVMCVPLLARDQCLGVIYVDQRASTRSFSRADLRFFEAFAEMLAVVWNNRNVMEERIAAARMKQDMELASTIQGNLLPERPLMVDGYSLCGRVIPAAETGGDYFDFFKTHDDRLVMAVGDVSGHGVGAALVMSAARAYTRSFCQTSTDPAEILSRVNRNMAADIADDMFMSMFLCLLDPASGEMSYANAGHPGPILIGRDGTTQDLKVTGMALGVEEEADYGRHGPFPLGSGDTLVMFSDGLTELRQADGNLFGRQRLIELLTQHKDKAAPELLDSVFTDALAWGEMEPEHADDVTVALLRADG